MENKGFFNKFKFFYNERNGKMILFFGFYLIFFIFLGTFLRNINNNQTPTPNKEEKKEITTYDLNKIVNSDYQYEIIILDNEEEINFKGSKDNIDYENYENKYFLDIYNINQLIKKSKFKESKDNVLTYELPNKEINDILLTEKDDGINTIYVSVNDDTIVNKITLDLAKYLEKDKYVITISYLIGEEDENSIS